MFLLFLVELDAEAGNISLVNGSFYAPKTN